MGLRQRFRIVDFERVLEVRGRVSANQFRKHYVIKGAGDTWTLKEPEIPYVAFPGPKKSCRGLC